MYPLVEKFLIWITCSQLTERYIGQRSLQSLLCITQVSVLTIYSEVLLRCSLTVMPTCITRINMYDNSISYSVKVD